MNRLTAIWRILNNRETHFIPGGTYESPEDLNPKDRVLYTAADYLSSNSIHFGTVTADIDLADLAVVLSSNGEKQTSHPIKVSFLLYTFKENQNKRGVRISSKSFFTGADDSFTMAMMTHTFYLNFIEPWVMGCEPFDSIFETENFDAAYSFYYLPEKYQEKYIKIINKKIDFVTNSAVSTDK